MTNNTQNVINYLKSTHENKSLLIKGLEEIQCFDDYKTDYIITNDFIQTSFLDTKQAHPTHIYIEHNKEDMYEVYFRLLDIMETNYILTGHPYIEDINRGMLNLLPFLKRYHRVTWKIDGYDVKLYVINTTEELLEVLDLITYNYSTYDVYELKENTLHIETRFTRDKIFTDNMNIFFSHTNKHKPDVLLASIDKIIHK